MPGTTYERSRDAAAACADEVTDLGAEGATAFVTMLGRLVDGGLWRADPASPAEVLVQAAIGRIAPSPDRLGPTTLPLRLAAGMVVDEIGRLMAASGDPAGWLADALEDYAFARGAVVHPGARLLKALQRAQPTFAAALEAEALVRGEGRAPKPWDDRAFRDAASGADRVEA